MGLVDGWTGETPDATEYLDGQTGRLAGGQAWECKWGRRKRVMTERQACCGRRDRETGREREREREGEESGVECGGGLEDSRSRQDNEWSGFGKGDVYFTGRNPQEKTADDVTSSLTTKTFAATMHAAFSTGLHSNKQAVRHPRSKRMTRDTMRRTMEGCTLYEYVPVGGIAGERARN